ncbi:ATP-binding protein [Francisella tularensis]|uniref:ATP-binding protein n=1 Tax=Francisella tularensis TaxID=263 RepID=UPI00355C2A1F
MNPCPCGYLGSQFKECTDSIQAIRRYQSKLSGPLLDRIDLHVEVLSYLEVGQIIYFDIF